MNAEVTEVKKKEALHKYIENEITVCGKQLQEKKESGCLFDRQEKSRY